MIDRRTIVTAAATAPLIMLTGQGYAADAGNLVTVETFAAIAGTMTGGATTIQTRGWSVLGIGAAIYRRTTLPIDRHAARSAAVSLDGHVYALDHRGVIEVDQFGAIGDDRTDDRAAIQAAIDYWTRVGGILGFTPTKRYFLGRYTGPSDRILMIDHVRNAVIEGRNATLRAHSAGTRCQTYLFTFRDFHNLTINALSATDSGTDINVEWRGLYFVSPDANLGECNGLYLNDITVTDAVALLFVAGTLPQRIRNIRLRRCTAIRCYYGAVFAENGDAADIELATHNCRRSYFAYGISDHNVRLDISHDDVSIGANSCCLIKRYVFDTNNISINISFSGDASKFSNFLKIEHQPTNSNFSVISNISVNFSVIRATGLDSIVGVGFSSYYGSVLQSIPTKNLTNSITISGNVANIPFLVKSYSPNVFPISITLTGESAKATGIPTQGYAITRQ